MRIVGRRESGELNTSDMIVIVLISEAANVGFAGNANSIFDGVILVLTVVLWNVALDAAGYRWAWVRKLLTPKPRPLILNGELQHRTMRREFMTKDEVDSQLRINGIEDVSEVRRAYTEPNGSISVLKNS